MRDILFEFEKAEIEFFSFDKVAYSGFYARMYIVLGVLTRDDLRILNRPSKIDNLVYPYAQALSQ